MLEVGSVEVCPHSAFFRVCDISNCFHSVPVESYPDQSIHSSNTSPARRITLLDSFREKLPSLLPPIILLDLIHDASTADGEKLLLFTSTHQNYTC